MAASKPCLAGILFRRTAPMSLAPRHRSITTSAVLGAAAASVVAYNGCVIFYQHIFQNISILAFDYLQDKPLWNIYNYLGLFSLLVIFGIIFCE
eukprot:GGOE01063865.1.p2 GENE.GGOE01063865.1~~GGOE01063865.1.p2  ORF type:complete len:105 (-),score=28.57 GGOE01063865.1:133-414(-)